MLDRNVYCILGLPFDAVSMDQAVEKVRHAAATQAPCFISTPNVNFLIACLEDKAFRDSVIHSDLSIADGMSIIWISRLLKLPFKERVSGAGLFEQLRKPYDPPLRVFFFGGQAGVAEQACRRLNEQSCGIIGVGSLTPGFGSVEEMSRQDWLDTINAAEPNFVLVALGARKGQEWIMRNRARLKAPVISHLGAVVNFVAGTITRAPAVIQRLGLEWAWRIYQEPALWRRYAKDGLRLTALMLTKVLPYAIWLRLHPLGREKNPSLAFTVNNNTIASGVHLCLTGYAVDGCLEAFKNCLQQILQVPADITLDMADVVVVDAAFVGLLLMLQSFVGGQGKSMRVIHLKPVVKRIFAWHCVTF